MIVPDRVRLPLHFDAGALATEVLALAPESWIPHFNRSVYEGEWGGVPLRSVGGVPQLYANPAAQQPYADTPILDHCPECRGVLEQFRSPLLSVRLLALAPGAVIKEHRDYRLAWEDGEVRIHVPVITAPEVEFLLNGTPVQMVAGSAWYLNLSDPHQVANRSTRDRVHLVIDVVVDDWLTELMRNALSRDRPD